jgi:hypothetical protein
LLEVCILQFLRALQKATPRLYYNKIFRMTVSSFPFVFGRLAHNYAMMTEASG